jgi:hypothetical protein
VFCASVRDKPKDRERGVVDVLARAARDDGFIAQLTHQGDKALRDYDLTWQETAALLSGDIRWLEAHLGQRLSPWLRTWLDCRLQQEMW